MIKQLIQFGKTLAKIIIIISAFLLLLLFVMNGWKEAKYRDNIQIILVPSHEGCDEYKLLWKVKEVDNPSYNFLLDKLLYLENSKTDYANVSTSNSDSSINKLVAKGRLYRAKRFNDYISCRGSYLFDDKSVYKSR